MPTKLALRTRERGQGLWLVPLFLVLGIVCPTACVLWFMNDAAESQALSARQSVLEAYRGQLRLIRDQVEAYWESRAVALDTQAGRGTAQDFARMVKSGIAASVVLLRPDGSLVYPSASVASLADPAADRGDWRQAQALEEQHNWTAAAGAYARIAKFDPDVSLAARAAQAQIRSSLHTQKEAAIRAILEYFASGRLVNALDLQGRMIVADEHLLALRLMSPSDGRRVGALRRLIGWVNYYEAPMPSAQRLFLMDELRAMGVKATFPTYSAELLAARLLEAEQIRAGTGLEQTRVPELWKLSGKSGRVIALLETPAVMASMRTLMKSSQGATFSLLPPGSVIPPGAKAPGELIAAGPGLPGWQVALTLDDGHSMEEAARRRKAGYLWVGYIVIAGLCVTGLVLAQVVRRQFRLARLKTDLVAAVSHELKTPLASMRLLVDSLLDDQELDPRKTREYLALIAGENLRLTRLIENFLTFSRLERNRQRYEFTEVQPASIVNTAAGIVRERLEQPGCHFEVEVEHDLPAIPADPDALVTVLINLLDNAYKYTRDEKVIGLRVFRQGDSVAFEVRDNGIGIAAREQKRIFQRFYQVDQRLARETGGCGLGLAIVDRIVRVHGGKVTVKSQPGEGSVFTVWFPMRSSHQKAAA